MKKNFKLGDNRADFLERLRFGSKFEDDDISIKGNGEIDKASGKKIGWTKVGKFNISEKDFLTIAPNKKKFYQTTAFLILLYFSGRESKIADSVETKMPIQN